jgi:hypothetical protein
MKIILDKVLKVYFLVPLALVVVFLDFFLDFNLIYFLPKVPENILFFNFFFNIPHIVASNLLLLSSEVQAQYGRKIRIAFILSTLVTLVFHYHYRFQAFLYLHSLWTLKHVIMQQFNLSHAYGLEKTLKVLLWKLLGVLLGIIIYWEIYDLYNLKNKYFSLPLLLNILCVLFCAVSVGLFVKYRNHSGSKYIFANSFLILTGYFLYLIGFGFISVLIIRVIHDCTSFIFYGSVYNGKLQSESASRYLKILFKYLGLKVTTLLPPVLLSVFILLLPWKAEAYSFLMILSLMHYYSEGFTWKSGSVIRNYVLDKS